MTPRALWTHVILAALALVFAWRMAHRVEEKTGGPTSVVLLDADKGDVAVIEYAWPRGTSTVTSKGEGNDRTLTVALSREIDPPKDKKKDAKDAKGDAGPEAADAGPTEDEAPVEKKREEATFPPGRTVMNGVEALEPLKTRRTLGEVDASRLQAMGLEKPERTLTVTTTRGKKLVLELGEASFGGQGRYARVQGDSVVHLVEPVLGTAFEGAADTMMEKRPLPVNVDDVVAVDVVYGDKDARFVHRDREQSAKRKLVPAGDLTSTADEPGKLMTTVRNLRGGKLVTDDKLAGAVVAELRVELHEKKAPVVVQLLERSDGAGHLVRAGAWTWEITETQGKELLEDLDAALP